MADSLKKSNNLALVSVIVANVVVYYAVVQGGAIRAQEWTVLAHQIDKALPAALGLALVGIINGLLSAETKSRIVFLRWNHPLPGCQAFTRFAKADARIDVAALQRKYGPLPVDPREQNTLWYSMYKSVETEPAVNQVHRAFLFARDYTGLALMMLVALGTAGYVQIPSMTAASMYVAALLIQFILAGQAARNHGRRFVTTVLAIKGAGRGGNKSE
jgi:hypothetical protein